MESWLPGSSARDLESRTKKGDRQDRAGKIHVSGRAVLWPHTWGTVCCLCSQPWSELWVEPGLAFCVTAPSLISCLLKTTWEAFESTWFLHESKGGEQKEKGNLRSLGLFISLHIEMP